MKHKFSSMGRVAIALVLALSLSLVMAVPVAATHTSSAVIAFQGAESTVAGEASILDVAVTNTIVTDACAINIVKIDFSESDFTVTGAGADIEGWTGVLAGDVVTYTAATEADYIDPTPSSKTFSPAVTNPEIFGEAKVPAVLTTDVGSKAALAAGVDTGWIGYEADLVGVSGNAITVEYVNPILENSDLSVSVDARAITVSLKTDEEGACISTADEVASAIDSDGAAGALVDATADESYLTYEVVALTVPDFTGGVSRNVDKVCPADVTTLDVTSIKPDSFLVVAGSNNIVTAGEAFSVEITAKTGETIETKYAGDHFIDFTYAGGPTGITPLFELITFIDGVGTSPANFVLTDTTQTTVTIKATDELAAEGTSDAITISPASLASFTISVPPVTMVAGEDFDATAITVTAYDSFDKVKTDYVGTVTWTSTDENAELPDPYPFTTADEGVNTFLAEDFILETSGYQTITVTDGTVSETSNAITVTPAAAVSFVVAASPDVIVADSSDVATITVLALDKFGNLAMGYTDPKSVTFATSLGGITSGTVPFYKGVVTDTLKSTTDVGTATIKVTSEDGDFAPLTTTVKLLPVVDSITVTVDKDTILSDGVDVRTITATYKDVTGATVTAADGADYKVTFTTTAGQDGGFIITSGTLTTVPDAVSMAETGTVSGEYIGTASGELLGDFTATLTLVTRYTGLSTDVTDDLVISGTITATTMTFSGTTTAQDYPHNVIVAGTQTITEGVIVVTAGAVTTPTTKLSGPGVDYCGITGSMVVGVTLSAASVDPVAGVATVTLTTVADPDTVITVTADGIGPISGSDDITVASGSFKIPLEKGWNLISLPLVPTDSTLEMVLAGLIAADTVVWVDTFVYDELGQLVEKKWDPPMVLQITQINDGQGYWINMTAGDILTISGLELPAPPNVPPTYQVYEGWNLIGVKSVTSIPVLQYLGTVVTDTLEVIYSYDATNGVYELVLSGGNFMPGQGYWLAVSADGTIYP